MNKNKSNKENMPSSSEANRMFHEKLAILNENFIRFLRKSCQKQPSADLTPTVKDYLKHLRDLDSMYYQQNHTATNAQAHSTTTTTDAAVSQSQQPVANEFKVPPTTTAGTTNASAFSSAFGLPTKEFGNTQQTLVQKTATTAAPPTTANATFSFGFPATTTFASIGTMGKPPAFGFGAQNVAKTTAEVSNSNTSQTTTASPAAPSISITAASPFFPTFGGTSTTTLSNTSFTTTSSGTLFGSTPTPAKTPTASIPTPAAVVAAAGVRASRKRGSDIPIDNLWKQQREEPFTSEVESETKTTTQQQTGAQAQLQQPPTTTTSSSPFSTLFSSMQSKSENSLFAANKPAAANDDQSSKTPPTTTATATNASFTFGLPTTKSTTTTTAPPTTTATFSFGLPATTTNSTTAPATTANATFSFGLPAATTFASLETKKPPSFSFGAQNAATTTAAVSTSSQAASSFSFGLSTSQSATSTQPTFTFGGGGGAAQPSLFSAGFSSKLFSKMGSADNGDKDNEEGSSEKPEEFVPTDNIKPLVPLPPKVDVKSGEEDEEVLFETRCKLFRYDKNAKVNNERGTGEIKILRNKSTGRHRCVIRSGEAISKLLANFPILEHLKVANKSERVLTWSCRDFSEDPKGVDEIFLAKFNEQMATTFRERVEGIVKSLENKEPENSA